MRFPGLSVVLLALLLRGPRTASIPRPAQDVEVRLEAHEGKTHFYLGERIQLDLIFRNRTATPHSINGTDYQDLADDVEITPATGWFEWRTSSAHDYSVVTELGPKELRFPFVLNQGFVFRDPGRYRIRLTTRRLLESAPITTNAVAINLEAMSAGTEAELVRNLRNAIGSADSQLRSSNRERGEALAQLADLEGDDALRAKMGLILAGDEQMRSYSPEGMATTRNLPLQLSLLEAAWRNPQQMPLYDMPSLLGETRALLLGRSLPGWHMFDVLNADDPEVKRTAEERTADMTALLDTLPERTGANQAAALYYLLEFPGLSDADVDRVRQIVAAEFQTLDSIEQNMLLASAWSRLRDPAMIEPLNALLEKTPQNMDAIQRLIDLDPQGAKPYVIQAVCGQGPPILLDSVASLPFDTLPEVDGCLGDMLSTPPAEPYDNDWSMRAALAARFATAAILPQVRSGWKYPEQDSAVLPLLLRWSPDEAMTRIKADSFDNNRLMDLFFSIDKSFTSRQADFPPQLGDWLRQILQDGPDNQASFAAYQLSQGGARQDRAVLEARLGRLRKEWSGKDGEIEAAYEPNGSKAAQDARKLEVELVAALSHKGFWSLSDEELEVLTQACMSADCRRYCRPRKP